MKLLENSNRKCIRTLSDNCLRANKGRNAIAILAVILTAVLFMALTTAIEGVQISMKNQLFREIGTKFMVSIKNLTQEEAEQLVSDPEFAVAGIEQYVSMAVNPALNNVRAAVGWVDTAIMENSFMQLQSGRYPEKVDEIACDTEVLRLLGLPGNTIGSTFVLEYTAGNTVMKKEMTVCGIWEGRRYEQSAVLLASRPFVEEVLENYDGEDKAFRETCYDVRGSFASDRNIPIQLYRMVEKLGYDPSAERGEEGFLVHHVNPVYESNITNSTTGMYVAEGIGVALIVFAGYLIIYNIFKIPRRADDYKDAQAREGFRPQDSVDGAWQSGQEQGKNGAGGAVALFQRSAAQQCPELRRKHGQGNIYTQIQRFRF